MSFDFRVGNNTEITIVGNEVHKLSKNELSLERATEWATQLVEYAAAFDDEPIDIASLKSVSIRPASAAVDRYRVAHVLELCDGPNLCGLQGEALQGATARILSKVATMTTLDTEGTLRVPFDATAQNFHIGETGDRMVDIFPPLLRHADGSFPLENVQYSYPRSRQSIVPYTRGTMEGALLQILFSASHGDRPHQQAVALFRATEDWYYDVLPENLPRNTKDIIREQISRHFIPHFVRSTIADGSCVVRQILGHPPYTA